MKGIALLGSTGSIGTQSLDVCRMHGYRVVCLTANRRVDLMETQIREFRPDLVSMMDPVAADDLRTRVADTGTKVLSGMAGLIECATYSGAERRSGYGGLAAHAGGHSGQKDPGAGE